MITAKNYAAQAIKSLDEIAKVSSPYIQELHKHVCEEIERSVHFAMPDDGTIFDDDLRGLKDVEKFRLPFQSITIEYFSHQKFIDKSNTLSAPKRLIIAQEIENEDKTISIQFCVACYFPHTMCWNILPMGFIIKWDGKLQCISDDVGSTIGISGDFGVLNREHYDYCVKEFGEDVAEESMRQDIFCEIKPFLEFMEALSCTNVKPELLQRVDVAKQARRARNGKLPIFETYVLTIPGEPSSRKDHKGGTHSSPRQHLRRGHIRRLPSGNIWINSCVVGNPKKGVIEKQYQVAA